MHLIVIKDFDLPPQSSRLEGSEMPRLKAHFKYSRTFFKMPCQKCQRKLARTDVRLKEATFNQWHHSLPKLNYSSFPTLNKIITALSLPSL